MKLKKIITLLCIAFNINAMAQCWSKISAGGYHTLAIKTDGTLWTCGGNDNGQLGDGTLTAKNIPTQIGTANNWGQISAADLKKLIYNL
jgi:alpha-tubulin suppressor-like RCC1 family protein